MQQNLFKEIRNFWNNYRDELSNDINYNNGSNKKVIRSKPFKYKLSITGNSTGFNVEEKITDEQGNETDNPTYNANKIGTKEVEIVVPLKYLINFWRNLNMSFVNYELPLTLT